MSFSVGQVIYDPLLIANLSRVSWLVETILDILDEGDSQTWRVGIEWKPTSLTDFQNPGHNYLEKDGGPINSLTSFLKQDGRTHISIR